MQSRIILFDLDGTLIDSTEAVYEGFCIAFKHFHQDIPTFDSVKSQIGHTLETMFSTLGVREEKIPQYISAYKKHYRQICNAKTTLLPNAKEAILEAHTFAQLGIVTTKTGQYSKILLDYMGISGYFTCIIGRENVIHAKPSAEPILKALEFLLPLPKENIFMIGDTPLDIQAANNAGIQSIAVTTGYVSLKTLKQYTTNITNDALEAVLTIKSSL
ncbi:HAD family hydrolase [Helicobacter turcicus]|uniref:phosphoglycolate phosphatase n=1 Tax=Helicobacter turcicus TaxID=2867412 RepID=A0ABS7JMT3_9HELI|nr:HAD family hydrolase [Helicobacter turcicus]MBX7490702.1 HAD family hydrolase [Helicobacter turcicus]MBX7545689.1 HAD family hydrolase [Helicobacter turcicus]